VECKVSQIGLIISKTKHRSGKTGFIWFGTGFIWFGTGFIWFETGFIRFGTVTKLMSYPPPLINYQKLIEIDHN